MDETKRNDFILVVLFLVTLVILLFTGCASFEPIDKYDAAQGFKTSGFGRDLEVEYYESGSLKRVKATSNFGTALKGAGEFVSDAAGAAAGVF